MHKIEFLINQYVKGEISYEEKEDLWNWVNQNEDNLNYFRKYLIENDSLIVTDFDSELAYQKFKNTIKARGKKKNNVRRLYKYAAVFIVLLSVGYFMKEGFFMRKRIVEPSIVRLVDKELTNKKVEIRLADGSVKKIESHQDKEITNGLGDIVAVKNGDIIDFSLNKNSNTVELVYNEVSIPNGETFKIKLSDGTLVWLNAGSKLRFPQRFIETSHQRLVYLEGEAFFDVTKNKNKPFIVHADQVDIKVLGTRFNISSYTTDTTIKTTLVEGAVIVSEKDNPEKQLHLSPSYQASFDRKKSAMVKEKVDTSIYTSWMQDRLVMDNLTFSEILTKLERSHNVIFINNAKKINTEKFKGEFEKEQRIEDILKTISLSTFFTYEINQNKITISK
ncbi:FecR family protein [Aquimarina aquimarini]|uniref:FecR family protein n=1 Tax=Aquimarina aquimarini TaxID=1191734 RepID=UPI000D55EFC8|nr:FecR family protein [Aquimarina aquimarini]